MICTACGTDNEKGFKFCVKCGSNLDDPQEVNYEQVDMGGYHTEEEFSSDKRGFTVGSGTFTISDRTTASSTSDIYTADELNESEEEFDFSDYDEPFIPRLDTDRLNLPKAGSEPLQPQQPNYNQPLNQMGGIPNQPQMGAPVMGGMPQQQMGAPVMGGMPQQQGAMGANPYMGGQPMMYGQPPIIGYDPSGMPIYGQAQPMMYAQPQIIGYDPSGMPIYGQAQPVMYAQPQIIGYDPSGMPIYGQAQPMMYAQPQIIGYDPNGMPIYSQPAPVPEQPATQQGMQGMPAMQGMPTMGGMPGMPGMYGQPAPKPQPAKSDASDELVDVSDDFWKFFDGGTATKHRSEPSADDFFGKSSHGGMGDLSAAGMDMSGLRRAEKKKNSYMNDTPIVDGDKLARNESDKFNKFYMRQTESVNADDLAANAHEKVQDVMGITKEVDADLLSANTTAKSRITMHSAGEADADTLEAYTPEHKEALMAQAEHAVEAMPKKVNPYESELDKIELPEYMQAKKTAREETIEIPSLPQVGID